MHYKQLAENRFDNPIVTSTASCEICWQIDINLQQKSTLENQIVKLVIVFVQLSVYIFLVNNSVIVV